MANFEGIIFDEYPMPSFVRVLGITHSILPPISQNLMTVGGKAGAYDFGNTIGTREITVDIAIVAPEENVLPQLLEQLSWWLYHDEPKELILGDNPNKYYIAKFTGDSEIKELFRVGQGSITFLCTDPYIYGAEREFVIPSTYKGQELELVNEGNSATFPEIEVEITKNVSHFSVVAGDEYIDLGEPFSLDTDEADLVDAGGYVFRDYMKSLAGWIDPPSVYGGTIAGTFEVVGNYAFRQAGLNYGSGTGWHGASMIKNIEQNTTDFESHLYFRMNADSPDKYVGKITVKVAILNLRAGASTKHRIKKKATKGQVYEVEKKMPNGWYKLENGLYCSGYSGYVEYRRYTIETGETKMGWLQMQLTDENNNAIVVASAKDATSGSKKVDLEVKLLSGNNYKTIFKRSMPSKYLDFEGYYKIVRKKNVWYVEFWREIGINKYTKMFSEKYTDSKKTYSRKIGRVQVATLAYKTYPVPYMEIKDAVVITKDVVPNENQTPIILRVGDKLSIDNETGAIKKNGRPFYQYINPSSTFIKLESGSNGLIIHPHNAFKNGVITYTERTL